MTLKHLRNLFGDKLHTLPLLVLYLTDGCNSRCVTCDIWQNPRKNMEMSLVDDLVAASLEFGVRWVLLSGGEAMQHPQWDDIARRFHDNGIYVMLLTNGLLLKRQADRVLSSVDEVIVSLDGGTSETYHAIRGVDGFDLILDGIRMIRSGNLPVITRTTLQRANYAEMPEIIDAAVSVDVNRISFLTVDVSSEVAFGPRFEAIDPDLVVIPPEMRISLGVDDFAIFETVLDEVSQRYVDLFTSGRIAESPEKLRRMLTYFRAVGNDSDFVPPRCNAPHVSTVIEVDGTVRPCYFLPSVGKVDAENSLRDVVNNDISLALRRAYQRGERPECARCVCPLYKGPRSLIQI